MAPERPVTPWATTARDLYLVAMAVFLVTIVIGILNGADAVEFDRNAILTHVHSGTVGWLTLTIVASTFLLLRATDRRLMLALAVLVPVYALPFNILIASDHAVYIGVITNVVIGLLSLLFLRGRAPAWMTQVIFWGVNLGLLVFAIGLIVDTAEIKRIGAPVMGVTLLVALALLAARAWGSTPAELDSGA